MTNMKLWASRCACEPVAIDRIERTFWMRLLPGLRAYRCRSCGQAFLASRDAMARLSVEQRQQAFAARRGMR